MQGKLKPRAAAAEERRCATRRSSAAQQKQEQGAHTQPVLADQVLVAVTEPTPHALLSGLSFIKAKASHKQGARQS